jgi:hypothetical protein
MGQRVVLESSELQQFESRGARPRGYLGRSDQALVLVCTFGDEAGHVFRSDDGKEEGSPIAVDRREKNQPARSAEFRQGVDGRARVGYVLEHLHAADHIERGRLTLGQLFCWLQSVVDGDAAGSCVQTGNFDHARGAIDRGHTGTAFGERLG